MRWILGAGLALLVAACQTPTEHPLLRACQDYTGAHEAFIQQAELGTFDVDTLVAFRNATKIPTGICAGDVTTGPDGEPITIDEALARVRAAYFEILKLQQQQAGETS